MAYCGYVTTLKNVRPHSNADRMKLADCFGNTICVGIDAAEGEIGVYFPTDGQLSVEYCAQNDLVRRKDENGNPAGGYLDPEKRNIRAIKLRGEKSDGLFMPLSSFAYTGVIPDEWPVGTPITIVNGHEICQKYIPHKANKSVAGGAGARVKRRAKRSIAPLFYEHKDTEQLAYNLAAFKPGDEIEITLKMHGTSQRTAHTKTLKGYKDSFGCRAGNAIRNLLNKMGAYHGEEYHDGEPIYDWGYVTGTRRVVLDDFDGGFYGSNEFRKQHADFFEGKLWKGETVYYEVVGFTHTGAPIMTSADNKKINDKEFAKMYGKETVFSYGCSPTGMGEPIDYWNEEKTEPCIVPIIPQSDIYVYRMTMTNEDGEVVEYTPDFMRYRCELMGVKTVPVFHRVILQGLSEDWDVGEAVQQLAEQYYDGPDPIGKTHVREGVVVRILNRPTFTAYKHKNFSFKVLEGICKDEAVAPDMEEAQECFSRIFDEA